MSRAFRLGIFVVMALVILATGVFLIGANNFMFSRTYELNASFHNVDGLNNGADVRVGGIHVGTVKRINLPRQPNEQVNVVMTLKTSTRSLLRKDSTATIKTEGLLGNKYVEISFGSEKAAEIQNGDAIRSEHTPDVIDVTKDVAIQAKAAVASFQDNMEALKHNFLLRGFFKDRGYTDASELTQHAISQLPSDRPNKEFDYDAKQIFGKPESAKLQHQRTLNEAGQFLQENKFNLAVVAAGETKGDTNADHLVTEARANAVRNYLADAFRLDDTKIRTIGLGKSGKSAEDGTVQILVYGDRSTIAASQDQSLNGR